MAQRFLETHARLVPFDTVDRAERPDDHFARRDRRDEADADLPVEAERCDDRLDDAADRPREALGDLGSDAVLQRDVGEDPECDRHPEDHRSGALQEDLRPVEQAQAEPAEGGHPVGRHLEDERGPLALQDGRLQDARRGDRREKSEDVEAEQRGGAGAQKGADERRLREERRDDQGVDGESRRAGHERGDEDRRDPVALVLDRARRQDGRYRAGVGGKEGNERLPLEADLRHRPVGDQGRAREVARVLQDADEEEEEEDLREEDHDRTDARPDALDEELAEDARREHRSEPRAGGADGPVDEVHEGRGGVEDRLEDGDDDDEEDERAGDGMQEEAVEAARPDGRRGGLIFRRFAHARGPLAAAREVGEDREEVHRPRDADAPPQELQDRVVPLAGRRADERDGRAEPLGESFGLYVAAALLQLVGHVQDDEGRQTQGEDRRRQDEVAAEVRDVEDEEDRVGLRNTRHPPHQDVVRHLLVLRARREAVDAREVDDVELGCVFDLQLAEVLLDRDAGKVGDLLAQTGQAVEEGRLAGVGGSDDRHDARTRISRTGRGAFGRQGAREGREADRIAHDAVAVSFRGAGRR